MSFPLPPQHCATPGICDGEAHGGGGVDCDGAAGGSVPASLPVLQVQLRAINIQLKPILRPIKGNHSLVACFL